MPKKDFDDSRALRRISDWLVNKKHILVDNEHTILVNLGYPGEYLTQCWHKDIGKYIIKYIHSYITNKLLKNYI